MTSLPPPQLPLASGGNVWVPERNPSTRLDGFSLVLYFIALGFIGVGIYSWVYYAPSRVTPEGTFMVSMSNANFFTAFMLASTAILVTVLRAFFTGRIRSMRVLRIHLVAFFVSVVCSSLSIFGPGVVVGSEVKAFNDWSISSLGLPEDAVIASGLEKSIPSDGRGFLLANGQSFTASIPDEGSIVFTTILNPDGSFSVEKVVADETPAAPEDTVTSPTPEPTV